MNNKDNTGTIILAIIIVLLIAVGAYYLYANATPRTSAGAEATLPSGDSTGLY